MLTLWWRAHVALKFEPQPKIQARLANFMQIHYEQQHIYIKKNKH